MRTSKSRSLINYLKSLIFLPLVLLQSNVLLADSTDVSIVDELRGLASSLKENARQDEKRRMDMEAEIIRLESLVNEQTITNDKAREKLNELRTTIDLEKKNSDKIQVRYDLIQQNFNKYVFKTRAQKIIPFLYAAAAVYFSDVGAKEKIIYALAGYGTGALVENTGYGASAVVTFLRYSIF